MTDATQTTAAAVTAKLKTDYGIEQPVTLTTRYDPDCDCFPVIVRYERDGKRRGNEYYVGNTWMSDGSVSTLIDQITRDIARDISS